MYMLQCNSYMFSVVVRNLFPFACNMVASIQHPDTRAVACCNIFRT